MKTGYPRLASSPHYVPGTLTHIDRFFIHKTIRALADLVLAQHGKQGESAMLFPTLKVAVRCRAFIQSHSQTSPPPTVRIVEYGPSPAALAKAQAEKRAISSLAAVLFPEGEFKVAKQYWQHSGDGISSRRAEFCEKQLREGLLVEVQAREIEKGNKGPSRYRNKSKDWTGMQQQVPIERNDADADELRDYVEEKFGRNLEVTLVENAKLAVRRRIAGSLRDPNPTAETAISAEDARMVKGFTEDDVYLYPCGMNAIFNAHRLLLHALGTRKSVCYGYVSSKDTITAAKLLASPT